MHGEQDRGAGQLIQRGGAKIFTNHNLLEFGKPTDQQLQRFFASILTDARTWRKPQKMLEAELPKLERDTELPKWDTPAAPIDPAQQDRNQRAMRGIRMKLRQVSSQQLVLRDLAALGFASVSILSSRQWPLQLFRHLSPMPRLIPHLPDCNPSSLALSSWGPWLAPRLRTSSTATENSKTLLSLCWISLFRQKCERRIKSAYRGQWISRCSCGRSIHRCVRAPAPALFLCTHSCRAQCCTICGVVHSQCPMP